MGLGDGQRKLSEPNTPLKVVYLSPKKVLVLLQVIFQDVPYD